MHPTLIKALRAFPPLEIMSTAQILAGINGPGKAIVTFRNQARRELKKASVGFPPLGDQTDVNSEPAYFGFRWMAATVSKPVPLTIASRAMDLVRMAEVFPDLKDKLALLEFVIVSPEDLHPFVTAIPYGPRFFQKRGVIK